MLTALASDFEEADTCQMIGVSSVAIASTRVGLAGMTTASVHVKTSELFSMLPRYVYISCLCVRLNSEG